MAKTTRRPVDLQTFLIKYSKSKVTHSKWSNGGDKPNRQGENDMYPILE